MNRHIVMTGDGIQAEEIRAALHDAGIEASASPAHLQGVARLAALVLSNYPPEQRASARDTLDRWITALEAAK